MVAELVRLLMSAQQHEFPSPPVAVEAHARLRVLCGAGPLPPHLADCPGPYSACPGLVLSQVASAAPPAPPKQPLVRQAVDPGARSCLPRQA